MKAQRTAISFLVADSLLELLTASALAKGVSRNSYLENLVSEHFSLSPRESSFDKPPQTKPVVSQIDRAKGYNPNGKTPKLLPMSTLISGQMASLHQMLMSPDYEQTLDGVEYYYCLAAQLVYRVSEEKSRSGQIKFRMVEQRVLLSDLHMHWLGNHRVKDIPDGADFIEKNADGYHQVKKVVWVDD